MEGHTEFSLCLKQIQGQFLCCYALNSIEWHRLPKELSWEQQEELIQCTCRHVLNEKYPIKLGYQLNFLKRLLQWLERNCAEVHDAFYECLCTLQQKEAQDATENFAYRHYRLPAYNSTYTLRESKSFVAAGTTGLCSWQAALALSDFVLHHPEFVDGKCVLELGAGTGLCGLITIGCCDPQQLVLSDGSRECVELMRENIVRNFEAAQEISRGTFVIGKRKLEVMHLPWVSITAVDLAEQIKPDIVLAADVVYDDSIFGDLSHALDFIFEMMQNRCKMLLAATVRNEHTLDKFTKLLENLNFTLQDQKVIPAEVSHLFWDRSTAIRILLIQRD